MTGDVPVPREEIRYKINKRKSQGQWPLKWDFICINEATASQLAGVDGEDEKYKNTAWQNRSFQFPLLQHDPRKHTESKTCNIFKLCHHCGFLWCHNIVGWVAGMFYFLWVKWRQPLGYSAMKAICEPVNKSNMGEPKRGAEDYILNDSSVKPEQMRTGVRSTSHGSCAELKDALLLVLRPSPIGPAEIYCLLAPSLRGQKPGPWAVFELQGCWVKFSVLSPNIIYAQTGHLLTCFSQKLLAPSWVR